jgi:hypothetical protein
MRSTLLVRRCSPLLAAALAALSGAACGGGGSSGTDGGAGSATTQSGGASGQSGSGGSGGDIGSGGTAGVSECVATQQVAELTALEVYLMLDQSGSMVGTWDMGQYDDCTEAWNSDGIMPLSRWEDVTKALNAFMVDPKSAGIELALGFFPPKGDYKDTPKCEDNKCDISAYSTPSVSVGPLPDNAAAIADALDFTPCPCNGTPMSAALTGAVGHAQERAAMTDHKVVVILATDGVPNGACSGAANDSENYPAPEDIAHEAFNGTKSIPIYVIGVGQELTSLNKLAEQGGTGSAFLIDGNQGTEQALIAALNEIRGQALSCEVAIPEAPEGQTLEPGKVNVTYSPGDGSKEVTFTMVKGKGDCSASPKSWYYDDPASPTKVILCEAACSEVQGLKTATLHVGFGCETILAVPE